jgi:hypothetical protein
MVTSNGYSKSSTPLAVGRVGRAIRWRLPVRSADNEVAAVHFWGRAPINIRVIMQILCSCANALVSGKQV